jgi:hypothetical protein
LSDMNMGHYFKSHCSSEEELKRAAADAMVRRRVRRRRGRGKM